MRAISFTSAVLACALLGSLGALTLADIFDGPGNPRQERVARTPPLPTSVSQIPKFLGNARYFATERYALKETFITLNGMVKMAIFDHSPATNVLLGEEGFLFFNVDEAIDGAQGKDRLDATGQAVWADYFKTLDQNFQRQGLPFSLVIGPNKHSIYPDLTPDWLAVQPLGDTRAGDIMTVAQAVLGDQFVDTRDLLQHARIQQPDVPLYHPTDTHWTEWGAALALHDVLARQNLDLPAPQFEIADLVQSGDLSRMVGQQHRWAATAPTLPKGWSCADADNQPLFVTTIDPLMPRRFTCGTPGARPEKIVVFTDSFGVSTIPYLSSRFQTVDFIWSDKADPDAAKALGADYVLQILVERKLMTDTPQDFLVQSGALR
ncbi:alginate O-acetyltransferase AlgX-related protein [Algirhabdus cladophorae]|uniref:alginate O-acetyltransferase AlgX-related protein n=1 Tax=Algirhabdus cladophorae TaxID=3377108 RepID=UPI003B84B488